MLDQSTVLMIHLILVLAGITVLMSNNLLNFLLAAEYTNFLVFPLLILLATTTNNPNNLLLIIPTSIFSAVETILAASIIFYNTK